MDEEKLKWGSDDLFGYLVMISIQQSKVKRFGCSSSLYNVNYFQCDALITVQFVFMLRKQTFETKLYTTDIYLVFNFLSWKR